LKELREARYWLRLTARAELFPIESVASVLAEAEELVRIFSKSVVTAKQNRKQ
jgi:hypothetical protein